MFITGKNYHLGSKTFWFFFFTHNKLLLVLLGLISFISYHIRYGFLKKYVVDWLVSNYSYIEITMVAMWLWMIIGSFFAIVLLRTSVLYKQYSFTLHKHALHVKQGIFFVREHVMPYHQIVNVEIQRPYIYAPFGLVQVDIITGQSDIDNVSISKSTKHQHKKTLLPVLDKKIAITLAHELMRRSVGEHNSDKKNNTDKVLRKRRR